MRSATSVKLTASLSEEIKKTATSTVSVPTKKDEVKVEPKAEVVVKENQPRETPQQKLEIHSTNCSNVSNAPASKASVPRTFGMRQTATAKPEGPQRIKISDLPKFELEKVEKLKVNLVGLVDEQDPSHMILCDENQQEKFDQVVGKVQAYCKTLKADGYVPV